MKSCLLLHFYMALSWQYQSGAAKDCIAKSSGCGCDFDDNSGSIDFKPISNDSPMFSSVPATDPSHSGPFSYDFCKQFSCGESQAYACNTFDGQPASIGNDIQYDYDDTSRQVTMRLTADMSTTIVALHCKEDQAGKGDMSSVVVQGLIGGTSYSSTLTSKYACLAKDSDEPKSGLSIGSILCITLLVIVVVYIVVGILVNKYVRKSEELFPNKMFWKALPFYAKDGCLFTCNRIRGKSGETYDAI